ncbi:hypothetical protein N7509_005746 [Penicillium cosmopolitanum]|uniref:Myb-like domain-containing protein n=1 Tax=Penicillium cosmopolitanum TaxID=1131564 RepID=A0A9W9W345_9EURO|nr:uncharacterized protein N7509_005746 [Penicillium cosmopolitanum]KAJ5397633.1 hypothetical protein N7509_005746 [Penicillium cosmopolitanum]
MLLPSALPCDVRRSSRFTPSRLFSTPPPSDRGNQNGNGLLGTCRALQSLLNGSPAPSPRRSVKPQRLQSPLLLNPPRRSTRSRKLARPASPRPTPPPTTLATTPPPAPSAPARGANKRRRSNFDDESDSDNEISRNRPSTPKRQRHIPYELPLGLSSTDFYSLHSPPITQSPPSPAQRRLDQRLQEFGARVDPDAPLPSIEEADASAPAPVSALSADEWSVEEDQRLLQLVLERFRLSQKNGTSVRAKWVAKPPATSGDDGTLSLQAAESVFDRAAAEYPTDRTSFFSCSPDSPVSYDLPSCLHYIPAAVARTTLVL